LLETVDVKMIDYVI